MEVPKYVEVVGADGAVHFCDIERVAQDADQRTFAISYALAKAEEWRHRYGAILEFLNFFEGAAISDAIRRARQAHGED